ncbi:cysteine-rich CWC family protein [Lutispora thermophila]
MDEKICPLCGNPNNCQHGEGTCWCENVAVPKKF